MQDFDGAIVDYDEAIQLDSTASHYNGLAWLLATCPVAAVREGKRALELGTNACEIGAWKNDSHVGTLSAAYAEAGDFESALKYLDQAIELNPESHKAKREEMRASYLAGKPYHEPTPSGQVAGSQAYD